MVQAGAAGAWGGEGARPTSTSPGLVQVEAGPGQRDHREVCTDTGLEALHRSPPSRLGGTPYGPEAPISSRHPSRLPREPC